VSVLNARKTHCLHGHEYTEATTYVTPRGVRECRKCRKEANRRLRTGESFHRPTTGERFWSKVDKTDTCWLWVSALASGGYGQFSLGGRPQAAHRVAYELLVGPIPDGLSLDHMCHERLCVNPDHLRAVTTKQNMENRKGPRKDSASGIRGVYLNKRLGRWFALVGHNGKQIFAGSFASISEAEAAAVTKRNELFTHNDTDPRGSNEC